jgi:hypothetical protein
MCYYVSTGGIAGRIRRKNRVIPYGYEFWSSSFEFMDDLELDNTFVANTQLRFLGLSIRES